MCPCVHVSVSVSVSVSVCSCAVPIHRQGLLFVVGGQAYEGSPFGPTLFNDVWTLNGSLTWTSRGTAPWSERAFAAVAVFNNNAYLSGGTKQFHQYGTMWLLNGTTLAWSRVSACASVVFQTPHRGGHRPGPLLLLV